jgi:hypothetical protein
MTFYAKYESPYFYGNVDRLYGVGVDVNLIWIIQIDWDGDGVYDGSENENEYTTSLFIRRGRNEYIKVGSDGKAEGFEPTKIGTCTLVLDNSSRRFDPYNTASDLYPNVLPGRFIRIRNLYNGVTSDVFHGKIKNIVPIESGRVQQVRIECEDGQRNLQSADVFSSIQTNINLDAAINLVLDDADYPTLYGRDIQSAADVVPYWWANDRAMTEIQRLTDAELGTFFIAADGKATFLSRRHSATPVLNLTSADLLKDISIPQPWEVVRNYIKIFARPRVIRSNQVLWTIADAPPVSAGGTLDVWATYQYNNIPVPAINTAVSSSDYAMNSAADGSGANVSSDFTVSLTDFGETGKITITNNGAATGYVTLLQVTGDAIDAPDPSLLIKEDTTSQGLYGKAVFTLDNPWLQSTSTANDFSIWLASFLPTPQRFITVQMETRPETQYVPDLFDVINLSIPRLGISQNFKIGGIEHRWTNGNGQAVVTTWNLEPFPDVSGYWIFDINTGNVIMGVGTIFGF